MKPFVTVLLLLSGITQVVAQHKPPIIRTKTNSLILYVNNERGNFNGINELPNTFQHSFGIEPETVPLQLVSEQDSVSLTLRQGQQTVIRVIRQAKGDTITASFTAHKLVKAAVFSDAYKKENQNKTIIQIPEVYELVNVVFALTDYGKTEAIYKGTDYYRAVMDHFSPHRNHPAVRTIDSLLKQSDGNYYPLKMDAYAYQFAGDTIQKGAVYDRVSWGEVNELAPYIKLLDDFSKKAGFRRFYQQHADYYKSLVADYQKNVDVSSMKSWLEKQFPRTQYAAIKVIFTPLVGWNQSANQFEDNGFKEAQAHVNFPFVNNKLKEMPAPLVKADRMMIAFTEINHTYLNPEADRYNKEIVLAYKELSDWITPGKPSANYNNPLSCFEEYMNYGLVTLFYADVFGKDDFEKIKAGLENNMVTNRGFKRFREFDQELLRLYQTRQPGQTVADLYPAIIAWVARQ
ncbi:DUF4932 domain-containing protein [Larkinella insperata]|uniref:DUF4932 domain-containing protein n=1 Tax=Larkinella insperata TaxID=332158 RepID=A0ABW3QIR3_9BACT|nr:DUF4932 domain-containing protein [Larkinella insperata]